MKKLNIRFIIMMSLLIILLSTTTLKSIAKANEKYNTETVAINDVYRSITGNDATEIVKNDIPITTQMSPMISTVYAAAMETETEQDLVEMNPVDEQQDTAEQPTEVVECVPITTEEPSENVEYEQLNQNYGFDDYDIYIWAKIVMAESEGESQLCKEYVAQTILNRVLSDEFPDTIEGVVFDGHQFSPTFDGRWERVEPNQDCYNAVNTVINSPEPIINSLYFECCAGDSWHSRNLNLILEEDGTRFYN